MEQWAPTGGFLGVFERLEAELGAQLVGVVHGQALLRAAARRWLRAGLTLRASLPRDKRTAKYFALITQITSYLKTEISLIYSLTLASFLVRYIYRGLTKQNYTNYSIYIQVWMNVDGMYLLLSASSRAARASSRARRSRLSLLLRLCERAASFSFTRCESTGTSSTTTIETVALYTGYFNINLCNTIFSDWHYKTKILSLTIINWLYCVDSHWLRTDKYYH